MNCIRLCAALFLFAIGFAGNADAQYFVFHPMKHELGIDAFTVYAPSSYRGLLKDQRQSVFIPLSGIRYRLHLGARNALRFNVAWRKARYENVNSINNRTLYNADQFAVELAFGYQRIIPFGRSQIYFAADAMYVRSNYVHEVVVTLDSNLPTELDETDYSPGFRGVGGFRYMLSKTMALSGEIQAYYIYRQREARGYDTILVTNNEYGYQVVVYFSFFFKRIKKMGGCPVHSR